jgi:hypothetical protein
MQLTMQPLRWTMLLATKVDINSIGCGMLLDLYKVTFINGKSVCQVVSCQEAARHGVFEDFRLYEGLVRWRESYPLIDFQVLRVFHGTLRSDVQDIGSEM